jgi:tetratricopeptide (TPR) repeat protein
MLLDAELFMASGMPEDALAAVGDNPTLRGHLLKGRALIDLGKPGDALVEFDAGLAIAPDDVRVKAYRHLAVVLVEKRAGGSRSKGEEAFQALTTMARGTVSGLPRYVLAEADLALGKPEDARRDLEASLEGDNPLAYRARTRLAEIFLVGGRTTEAEAALREGLVQSPVYVPAHAILGRILLKQGKTEEGAAELESAVTAGRASGADELAYATALVALGRKEEARAPLQRAKEKGASPEEIGAVAVQVDPALPEELGVPVPKGGGSSSPSPEPAPKRRRGR